MTHHSLYQYTYLKGFQTGGTELTPQFGLKSIFPEKFVKMNQNSIELQLEGIISSVVAAHYLHYQFQMFAHSSQKLRILKLT